MLESVGSSSGIPAAERAAWLEPHALRTPDGTDLACYLAGNPDGPALVLCPGLGGGAAIWQPFVDRFGDRYRLLTWDYRGLYRSGAASDPAAYAMSDHVADLLSLLEHEAVEAPLLIGWSMGVQLGLEVHREHPELPSAFVAIHGTSGRPLSTAFGSSSTEWIAPLVLAALRQVGDRFSLVGPRLTRSSTVVQTFVRASRILGFMSDRLDVDAFRDMAEDWTRLDLRIYAEIFERLGAHDASELLASIATPTLVIAGDRDRFTPAHLARQMAAEMPNATLEVIAGATHFGLLEYPDPIVRSVERFLDDLMPPGS